MQLLNIFNIYLHKKNNLVLRNNLTDQNISTLITLSNFLQTKIGYITNENQP